MKFAVARRGRLVDQQILIPQKARNKLKCSSQFFGIGRKEYVAARLVTKFAQLAIVGVQIGRAFNAKDGAAFGAYCVNARFGRLRYGYSLIESMSTVCIRSIRYRDDYAPLFVAAIHRFPADFVDHIIETGSSAYRFDIVDGFVYSLQIVREVDAHLDDVVECV